MRNLVPLLFRGSVQPRTAGIGHSLFFFLLLTLRLLRRQAAAKQLCEKAPE